MMLKKILGWLVKNPGWRLLSLAIAYGIWFNVANEPEMSTIVSAPLQYRDAGNNLEISSPLVDRVELETRGPSGLLRNLSNARTAVILDFSDVHEPGDHTFTITRTSTNLPQGVELLRATPAQIRLTFEKRERRTVPVHLRFTGALPNGEILIGTEVVPETVEIFGPASQVQQVSTVETDSIDLGSITPGHLTARVAVFVPEPKVRFAGSPEVTVRITIR
jgi:YbbR domain-containing protein